MAVDALRDLLGPGGWLDDPAETRGYRTDWRSTREGEALGVARPADTAAVAEVVRICRESGIALVPQGGNTGLVMGSIPTESRPTVVLTLQRMNRIRSIDAANYAMVAEAGCIIQTAQEAALAEGRQFPLSLASEGSSTVGGTLSTNAGGNNTIRFGNAREQLLGLEVVLADGTVLDEVNTLRKNNTGYDLKHLFVGAEGTLGIITAAAIRLVTAPSHLETALLAVPDPHAAQSLLGAAREISGDQVLAFELMPRRSFDLALEHIEGIVDPMDEPSPWYVLMELSSASPIDDLRAKLERIVEHAMEKGWVSDGVLAESEAQRRELWRTREEQAEAGRRAGPATSGDVSVPVALVADFLESAHKAVREVIEDVVLNTFGHMGDGNIHFNMRCPAGMSTDVWNQRRGALEDRLNEVVALYGGSFSAEHGIGTLKRDTLQQYASPARLSVMRTLKQALDPDGLLNPGKVL